MNSRGLFDLSENLLYILFIYLFFAAYGFLVSYYVHVNFKEMLEYNATELYT